MKFDAVLPPVPLAEVPAIARAAEQMGFDALWTTETVHSPFLPLTLAAEHTQTLALGTAIAVSFARSPGEMAYTAWDLAAQSGGRFMLGLGTQVKPHIERRFGLQWPTSVVGQLREQIEAMRALWDCWQNGSKLNYRGDYYKLTLMSPFFNPGPLPYDVSGLESLVPIYIAGMNTGLARLAGELCQGFHAHPFNSPKYLGEILIPAIEEGAKKTGRSRSDVSIALTAFAATTPEEQSYARAQIAFYASTPSYRSVMRLHGWEEVAEQLSAHASKGEWGEMFGLISDEMLETFCILTDAENLPAELHKRWDGLADRLTIYTPFVPGEKDDFWKGLLGKF